MRIRRRNDEFSGVSGGDGYRRRVVAVGWVVVVGGGGDAEVVSVVVAEDGAGEEGDAAGEVEVEGLARGGGCGCEGWGDKACDEEGDH